jgi:hypothetical protein
MVELTKTWLDTATAQAEAMKVAADGVLTQLSRQAVVEALALVQRDFGWARSMAFVLWVRVMRVASIVAAITDSRACQLVAADDTLHEAHTRVEHVKEALQDLISRKSE